MMSNFNKNPGLLKPGDTVGFFAPARKVEEEEMLPFLNWLESLGLNVIIAPNTYQSFMQFSGTDQQRASDLNTLWNHPEVKAIFCARGGYGCMRMLPNINLDYSKPKWLIGYSDITTLHLHLGKNKINSLHGPMGLNAKKISEPDTQTNFDKLQTALFEGKIEHILPEYVHSDLQFEGELIGGNLSLLYASLGTPEQPITSNKILFIEEIDEYYYQIDRMACSMWRAGIFDNIRALILGEFSDIKDNEKPFGMEIVEIFYQYIDPVKTALICDFPAGHGSKNFCLSMGNHCTFEAGILKQTLF